MILIGLMILSSLASGILLLLFGNNISKIIGSILLAEAIVYIILILSSLAKLKLTSKSFDKKSPVKKTSYKKEKIEDKEVTEEETENFLGFSTKDPEQNKIMMGFFKDLFKYCESLAIKPSIIATSEGLSLVNINKNDEVIISGLEIPGDPRGSMAWKMCMKETKAKINSYLKRV